VFSKKKKGVTMPIQYHVGYAPGLIGWMVAAQTRYYAAAVGFGMAFECKVASEIAEFVPRHGDAGNLLLWASDGDAVVGSIVIDGGTTPAARLRWFVVDPTRHGQGIGRELLRQALAFADQHHQYLWLTTIVGLDAAKHLYEASGFTLAAEHSDDTWGKVMHEQTWARG
jgi:GNAT superfamily N-acetyltransferase